MPSARDIPVLVQQLASQDPRTVGNAFVGLIDCLHNVPNARSSIANADGVTHTLSAMRSFPMEPCIQAFGCTLVHALLDSTGEATKRAVVEQGGVSLVVAALDRFPNEKICREQACRALYELASFDVSTVVGAISAMIKAVQRHPEDYKTLQSATACWAHLSHRSSAHQQALLEAVPVIVCVLKQSCENPQDEISLLGMTSHPVAGSCLLILTNVTNVGTNACSLIVNEKGVEAIITAIRLRHHSINTQSSACGLLSKLLEDNRQGVSQTIVEAGGIPLVVEAMELMALRESTAMEPTELCLKMVFGALGGVALAGNDCVVAIQKAGIVPVLILVLKKFKESAEIENKAMLMLWHFVSTNCDIPKEVFGGVSCILSEIFQEGGHEAILEAMSRHSGNTEIQRAGCMLLAALSSERDGNPTLVVAAGGIPVLEAAKDRHATNEDVQKFADISLDSLKDVPRCYMCNKTSGTLKACSRCKLTTYCSRECQRSHWKSGHKAVCNAAVESAAETAKRRADCSSSLEAQDKILRLMGEGEDEADYYVFLPSGDVEAIQFGNAFNKACFRLIRSRAPSSPYCVWRMYAMLKQSSEHDERAANNLPLIRRQLQAEYNVDPVSAHDAPQVGEITEEDFEQIQQSLGGGDDERRLLSLLPPAGPALEKQNKLLEESPETLYYVFDSPPIAISTGNKRNSECFKIVRKRAPISPRCLGEMYEFLISVLDANLSSADESRRRRVENVIRRQLETEYGRDPVDSRGDQDDVCQDAANYVYAAMVLGNAEFRA